ncbi:hypothetical protein JAAARDRAFT_367548 [Jaapia argillacea MUCL 33604]|uniref:Thioredoxin domain-containing protein n=1 Tax=Jaapia argillacea MUCL 33604 TaxID=933084 RepID=A0A067QHX4_9AGAM|nr:hypothetical protein JAAARDRAFT_367548 [Jaapia argillacea MUCL 33604]
MVLEIAPTSVDPLSLKNTHAQFLIFYSSRDERGVPWCPDCRDVEGLVDETFRSQDAPLGLIVYVGQRSEWKTPSNPFRGDPWKIESIPTVIKLHEVGHLRRLIISSLDAHHLIFSFHSSPMKWRDWWKSRSPKVYYPSCHSALPFARVVFTVFSWNAFPSVNEAHAKPRCFNR